MPHFLYVKTHCHLQTKPAAGTKYNKPPHSHRSVPIASSPFLQALGFHEELMARMEKFSVLPFSFGCVSQSSVAVAEAHSKKGTDALREQGIAIAKVKDSFTFFRISKTNISTGFWRLLKGIKKFPSLFVFREEDVEELRKEMEIGYPTDVKHVAHIGWDGSTTLKCLDNFEPPELLSLPSISLKQFEMAMAAQADTSMANAFAAKLA